MPARKPAKPRKATKPKVDLYALGGRVVGVFGPFDSRALIELPAAAAAEMFPEPLGASGRTAVIEATEREVQAVRERDEALGDSALAASAVAMAYEIAHPHNSATSKSMCAREMRDTLDRLRALAPPAEREDQLDDLSARRAKRLAG